jgi:alpha-beta hydrolase superfamily lysophospholipase
MATSNGCDARRVMTVPTAAENRRPKRLVRSAAVIACVALCGACAGGHHGASAKRAAPALPALPALTVTAAGYTVPAPLDGAAPGTLIATRDAATKAQELAADHAWQVLYHSTDLSGHDIAVSALVLVPPGPQPANGWPVVAWAHGTSGLADRCAPSIAPELAHDPTAVSEVRALLARGWVVVASDYPGLGTPGVHTYLIGEADARAVIDSVTATHALLGPRVAASWVVVGHSEGGQTALFVAQAASRRAPQTTFLGTVALAPASTLDALIPLAEATQDPVLQAYMIYALEGLSTVDPHLDVARVLTPQARSVLEDTTTGCIDDITNDLRRRHLDHLMAATPSATTRLQTQLGRYDDPDRAKAPEPIFIAQGTTDQDVPSGATDAMVSRLCALGDRLEYRHYPGLDHGAVVAGSLRTVTDWITARLATAVPATTCTTKS